MEEIQFLAQIFNTDINSYMLIVEHLAAICHEYGPWKIDNSNKLNILILFPDKNNTT